MGRRNLIRVFKTINDLRATEKRVFLLRFEKEPVTNSQGQLVVVRLIETFVRSPFET